MLHNVSGQIADLSDRGHLLLEGAASGPLQSFLRFIAASPLHGWTGHATADARGQGNGELKLKLDLPLTDSSHAGIDGQFRLPGNDVVLAPAAAAVRRQQPIAFSEKGFQLDNVRGRMLGGEVRASGGSQPDGSVRVVASGNASAAGIREAMAGTALAGLAGRLDGGAGYNAVIGVRDGQTSPDRQRSRRHGARPARAAGQSAAPRSRCASSCARPPAAPSSRKCCCTVWQRAAECALPAETRRQ